MPEASGQSNACRGAWVHIRLNLEDKPETFVSSDVKYPWRAD